MRGFRKRKLWIPAVSLLVGALTILFGSLQNASAGDALPELFRADNYVDCRDAPENRRFLVEAKYYGEEEEQPHYLYRFRPEKTGMYQICTYPVEEFPFASLIMEVYDAQGERLSYDKEETLNAAAGESCGILCRNYSLTEGTLYFLLFTQSDYEARIYPAKITHLEDCMHAQTELRFQRPSTMFSVGFTGDLYCRDCGELLRRGEEIPKLPCSGHVYVNRQRVLPATTEAGGRKSRIRVCIYCQEMQELEGEEIPRISKVIFTKKTFPYTKKFWRPAPKIYDADGEILTEGTDYHLSWKQNQNPGTGCVTVQFQNDYAGELNLTFPIRPKSVKITGTEGKKKSIAVRWKAHPNLVDGYEIQYSVRADMKRSVKKQISGSKKDSAVVKTKHSGRTYYVRVRTWKRVQGKKIYSAWSQKRKVRTK